MSRSYEKFGRSIGTLYFYGLYIPMRFCMYLGPSSSTTVVSRLGSLFAPSRRSGHKSRAWEFTANTSFASESKHPPSSLFVGNRGKTGKVPSPCHKSTLPVALDPTYNCSTRRGSWSSQLVMCWSPVGSRGPVSCLYHTYQRGGV